MRSGKKEGEKRFTSREGGGGIKWKEKNKLVRPGSEGIPKISKPSKAELLSMTTEKKKKEIMALERTTAINPLI